MINYRLACEKVMEYAKCKGIRYNQIFVKEYEDRWLFSYVPNGNNYTTIPKVFVYKQNGEVEGAHIPVPPLSNLEFYNKGKDIKFCKV